MGSLNVYFGMDVRILTQCAAQGETASWAAVYREQIPDLSKSLEFVQRSGIIRYAWPYRRADEILRRSASTSHSSGGTPVVFPHNTTSVIEAKGCLDGDNTNIFQRPPDADEFIVWSLCQNPGADPRHNVWSGIHTRLSAEIIHRRQQVDGLIFRDMPCRTKARPCPKEEGKPSRFVEVVG